MEKDKGENFKMTSIPIKIQRVYICKLNDNESVLIIVEIVFPNIRYRAYARRLF